MIEAAVDLGDLQQLGYKGAKSHIQKVVPAPILQSALIFNLDPKDGSWLVNLKAIKENQA
jgi:hypothetical protein